ncbi:MAG: hypothetical protein JOZ07_07010 [Solirubrobacterales bacterium]|nr:hypothetical protein [Solirubrobacterales bacterium]
MPRLARRLVAVLAAALVAGCGGAQATVASAPRTPATVTSGSRTPATVGSGSRTPATVTSGPRTPAGQPLTQVASGIPTPTSFAFGDGQVFVGSAGGGARHSGGVYLLGHPSRRLAGSPPLVIGVTWHQGRLYLSGASRLQMWSGFNGHGFTSRRTIYTGPPRFPGFNGLAFGADGRLYVGVGVSSDDDDDHGPTTRPYARDLLSFNASGGDLKIVASGVRQPFQLAFPSGSSSPYVSVLGQDFGPGAANAPDFIIRARPGQNYGFPTCNWGGLSACGAFTRPLQLLRPHTNPVGLAILGGRLYFNEFGGRVPASVVSVPLGGGAITPAAIGFAQYIVGLGTHGGALYVGEIDGRIFRVRP